MLRGSIYHCLVLHLATGCAPRKGTLSEVDDIYVTDQDRVEEAASRASAQAAPLVAPSPAPLYEEEAPAYEEKVPVEERYDYQDEPVEQTQPRPRQDNGMLWNTLGWVFSTLLELAISVALFLLIY